jgi:hypothetical protein
MVPALPTITLYASRSDKVFALAETLDELPSGEAIPRLGDANGGVFISSPMYSIDA